jgi:hypothetical protein
MDMRKDRVFDDIDKFFNEIIEKAKARCKQLKEQYDDIEK